MASFKLPELQQFCRPTPSVSGHSQKHNPNGLTLQEFSESQRESFCVYSGHGITSLRNYLNSRFPPNGVLTSDEGSRRGSGSSQSSITLPGRYSPPHPASNQLLTSYRGAFITGQQFTRRADASRRRGSRGAREGDDTTTSPTFAPVFRFASRPVSPSSSPGIPGIALTVSAPNFLSPMPGGMPQAQRSLQTSSGSRRTNVSPTTSTSHSSRGETPIREYRRGSRTAEGGIANQTSRLREESTGVERSERSDRNRELTRADVGEEEGGESSNGAFRWVTSTFGWERK